MVDPDAASLSLTFETILFLHGCSAGDAALLRDVARVFVRLFGQGHDAREGQLLDELHARVGKKDDHKEAVTIAGVEGWPWWLWVVSGGGFAGRRGVVMDT